MSDFQNFLDELSETNATLSFFTDFDKVSKNYSTKKNQKSFYFEDYVQTKDIENVNTKTLNNLKISFNRVIFVFFIFISLISIFS